MSASVLLVSKSQNLALMVARCLSAAGYAVHVLCEGALAPVRFSRHCVSYSATPARFWTGPREASAAYVARYCAEHALTWVVPADLDAALWLGEVRDQLSLGLGLFPVPSPALVRAMHDKWSLVGIMREHRVPHPRSQLVCSLDELMQLDLREPCFVKPTLGAFSDGAAPLYSRHDLDAYVAREAPLKLPLLAQELVPGRDIDMSVLAEHGEIRAWTIQTMGSTAASRVFVDDERVFAAGAALVAATRYHGVVHFDMRQDARDGSVKVLEANPRFWNTTPYSMWAGVNFPALGLAMAAGEPLVFDLTLGECTRPTLNPVDVLAWIRSGTPPSGLSSLSARAWRDSYGDPLPQVVHKVSGAVARLLALTA